MNSRAAMRAVYASPASASDQSSIHARGRRLVGAGEAEAGARGALVVQELPAARVGERRVREDQLARRERARVVLGDARAGCGRT